MASDSLLNTQAAGDFLSEQIVPHRPPEYWQQWLTNSRKTDRKQPFAIPFMTVGRAVFYEESDLVKFAEFQRQRMRLAGGARIAGEAAQAMRAYARGIPGSPVAGIYGRSWNGASVTVQNDEHTGTGGAIVQTTIGDPLMMFTMTPEQAVEFGLDLVKAGRDAQRLNKGAEAT